MSIATKRGDGGQTGLAGGIRVSKAHLRVESYGTVDELNTVLGFARSISRNPEIAAWTETIQRTLFRLGSALATPPESKKLAPVISSEDVEFLTGLVHRIETIEGVLGDWSLCRTSFWTSFSRPLTALLRLGSCSRHPRPDRPPRRACGISRSQ